ncbi:hypothetical protein HY30_01760 [Hyphomonas chukchiensis]|uniref:Uncharacterized protein n=1 Tax=Hyphomonas chukchiensis TaxID=1280947 RepID=A0A062UGI8_9PROT|nr:hypothetical protein HY30_01760 [Hyphomonas chukchiensis]
MGPMVCLFALRSSLFRALVKKKSEISPVFTADLPDRLFMA